MAAHLHFKKTSALQILGACTLGVCGLLAACGGGDTTVNPNTNSTTTAPATSTANAACTGDAKSVIEASALTAGISLVATGAVAGYFTAGSSYSLKSEGAGVCTLTLTTDTATKQKRAYKSNALDSVGGSATVEEITLFPDAADTSQKGQFKLTKTLATGKYSVSIAGLAAPAILNQP